jgi:hypothetical protein
MFTAATLLTLAIGIGANTAVFSVVNGVLIKPLPYPKSEELVGVWHSAPGVGFKDGEVNVGPTMYFSYREEGRVFQHLGIWSRGGVTVTGFSEPEQVRSLFVTQGVLDAVGVPPTLGRWFSREDDTPGTQETVLLTHGYWQRRFGGDRSVLGRTITVTSSFAVRRESVAAKRSTYVPGSVNVAVETGSVGSENMTSPGPLTFDQAKLIGGPGRPSSVAVPARAALTSVEFCCGSRMNPLSGDTNHPVICPRLLMDWVQKLEPKGTMNGVISTKDPSRQTNA